MSNVAVYDSKQIRLPKRLHSEKPGALSCLNDRQSSWESQTDQQWVAGPKLLAPTAVPGPYTHDAEK